MKRVMIIGQPGSGKSTFARQLGDVTHLPVVHIDHIHWMSGWIERSGEENDALCAEVHARSHWIFEGGRPSTWDERLDRADTLIWLDVPLGLRAKRVCLRTIRYWGRNRSDLPHGCLEQFSLEFWKWIWNTRHKSRVSMRRLFDGAPENITKVRLCTSKDVSGYKSSLRKAVAVGNLGISHR